MTKQYEPLSETQKQWRQKSNLLFEDAHRKAQSMKRLTQKNKQRARIHEILSCLQRGLAMSRMAKR